MTETAQLEKCLRCENTGYIVLVTAMGPQGPALFEIRPGNSDIEKVKSGDMVLSKCDCDIGNIWQPKT